MNIGNNQSVTEINSCSYLFLRVLTELPRNGLRVVLEEGIESPETTSVRIGNTEITGCHEVRVGEKSRSFEVAWEFYVAYSVRNESFIKHDTHEVWTGNRFRVYTKSRYLDFVAAATFATDEYPGPLEHVELICEDQIIDVISTKEPTVRRLSHP